MIQILILLMSRLILYGENSSLIVLVDGNGCCFEQEVVTSFEYVNLKMLVI